MKVIGMNTFLCPECGIEMDKVSTMSHYGSPIFLQQCAKCGGLWFDNMQPYQVRFSEVDKVDTLPAIDADKLRQKTAASSRYYTCPKDATPLEIFEDPNFPKDLQIQSCPQCGGFWFNHGEFHEFEEQRLKRMIASGVKTEIIPEEKKQPDEFQQKIDSLLKSHEGEHTYDSMAKAAQFLTRPVNVSEDAGSAGFFGVGDSSGQAANIVFAILRILMMLFLRG